MQCVIKNRREHIIQSYNLGKGFEKNRSKLTFIPLKDSDGYVKSGKLSI